MTSLPRWSLFTEGVRILLSILIWVMASSPTIISSSSSSSSLTLQLLKRSPSSSSSSSPPTKIGQPSSSKSLPTKMGQPSSSKSLFKISGTILCWPLITWGENFSGPIVSFSGVFFLMSKIWPTAFVNELSRFCNKNLQKMRKICKTIFVFIPLLNSCWINLFMKFVFWFLVFKVFKFFSSDTGFKSWPSPKDIGKHILSLLGGGVGNSCSVWVSASSTLELSWYELSSDSGISTITSFSSFFTIIGDHKCWYLYKVLFEKPLSNKNLPLAWMALNKLFTELNNCPDKWWRVSISLNVTNSSCSKFLIFTDSVAFSKVREGSLARPLPYNQW